MGGSKIQIVLEIQMANKHWKKKKCLTSLLRKKEANIQTESIFRMRICSAGEGQ